MRNGLEVALEVQVHALSAILVQLFFDPFDRVRTTVSGPKPVAVAHDQVEADESCPSLVFAREDQSQTRAEKTKSKKERKHWSHP